MDNLKKWGSLLAFIILAGISCWATEHSFHLLIKWMPEAFVWGLTIAFFIMASYGSKLIVDSLNKDLYIEHRRRDFWIGTTLVLIFWLFMSMPTNTHTFFYNHAINNVIQEDMTTTESYLSQIKNRTNVDSAYFKLHDDINNKFDSLAAEFNGIGGTGKRGSGEEVRGILQRINSRLERELSGSSIPFDDANFRKTDQTILTKYNNAKDKALKSIRDKKYMASPQEAKVAQEDIRKIELMSDTVKTLSEMGDIPEDIINQSEEVLLSGYTCIKNNNKYVKFDNEKDKELYTAENLETRSKRMLSVIDVWLDFFGGKYPISFFFYILLSILVDVAAFMFFNFAFQKED